MQHHLMPRGYGARSVAAIQRFPGAAAEDHGNRLQKTTGRAVVRFLLSCSALKEVPVRSLWIGLCVALSCVVASSANAQGLGVRIGVSGSPDQFYGGVHYESEPIIEHLQFRPNLEIGAGDNQTLVALNFEFVYKAPLRRQPWTLYLGAGPALDIYRFTNTTSTNGGFNILIGLAHTKGLFTELKVGAINSPSVKFGIGYTFRP